jgi:transcriptional regulator with XRE-family HTH domain
MGQRPVFHAELGAYFTELRNGKGWTQRQAADLAARRKLSSITYNALWKLEAGQTKYIPADVLRALSALYDVPYETIAGEVIERVYALAVKPLAKDRTARRPIDPLVQAATEAIVQAQRDPKVESFLIVALVNTLRELAHLPEIESAPARKRGRSA